MIKKLVFIIFTIISVSTVPADDRVNAPPVIQLTCRDSSIQPSTQDISKLQHRIDLSTMYLSKQPIQP